MALLPVMLLPDFKAQAQLPVGCHCGRGGVSDLTHGVSDCGEEKNGLVCLVICQRCGPDDGRSKL